MGKVILSGVVPKLEAPVGGILASELAVGSSVYLMEDGVAVEYLVVNQGIPSESSLYDSSCDGTWLLRKDIHTNRVWGSGSIYELSDIDIYLNNTFLGAFDSNFGQSIKKAKIPYYNTSLSELSYLTSRIFLLSGYEVGWTTNNNSYFPVDGACLDYFNGTAQTDTKRIGYYDGTATYWWLRTPHTNNTNYIWRVTTGGNCDNTHYSSSCGVRPALILPSTAYFDEDTLVLKGVA